MKKAQYISVLILVGATMLVPCPGLRADAQKENYETGPATLNGPPNTPVPDLLNVTGR